MALIKLGAFVTEISGKLGGTVFSRNRGGAYAKNRVVPLNPDTNFQTAVRSIFGAISQAWSGLTNGQRTSWENIRNLFPYQNRLGEQKILSGKALFQRLNNNLLNVGESIISDAPQPVEVAGVIGVGTAGVIDIGTGDEFSFELDLAAAQSDAKAVLECTGPLSAGTSFAKNEFRKLAVSAALVAATSVDESDFAASAAALLAAYEDRFGALSAGDQVQFRVKLVSTVSGQATTYWTESVTVVST